MNPWVTIVPIIVTVLLAIIGWLLTRLHTLNQVADTQRETITELRRQLDRLEIVAELTERITAQIPKSRTPGGHK